MKTASAKAKGRRLAAQARDVILSFIDGLSSDDVRVTPSGVNDVDLQLSPLAKEKFPFAVECKNQEKLQLWKAWDQTEKRRTDGITPLLIHSRNRSSVLVTLCLDEFLAFWGAFEKLKWGLYQLDQKGNSTKTQQ